MSYGHHPYYFPTTNVMWPSPLVIHQCYFATNKRYLSLWFLCSLLTIWVLLIYCDWLADDLLKLPALTSLLYTDSFSAISATLLSSMSLSRSTIPLKNIMLRLKQCRDGSLRPRKKSPLSSIVKQCVTQSMDISLGLNSLKEKKWIQFHVQGAKDIQKVRNAQDVQQTCLSRSSASLSFCIDSRCLASACVVNIHVRKTTFYISYFATKLERKKTAFFSFTSFTFSISSRCFELLWSPCIWRSEDPWR